MVIQSETLRRAPTEGLRPARAAKSLEANTFDFFLLQALKSLKTAKGIFGKAWRETAQIWKGLAKSLEPS